MSKFRRSMSRKASRRMFGKNAVKTERKNVLPHPVRGGIRL